MKTCENEKNQWHEYASMVPDYNTFNNNIMLSTEQKKKKNF